VSWWTAVPSPIGDLLLLSDGEHLTRLRFEPFGTPDGRRDDGHPVLSRARAQLDAYFAAELTTFDLPLLLRGTPFQLRVWAALQDIPHGRTSTYGELATALGLPTGSARAVGLGNNRNPVPVIVPCHRVIGANGMLTGFGGGLDRKRFLLDLEVTDGLF
jgi:methylated-DNA-[protein]-cysteine S-methyltransferase